jgi:hypothetical protein
VKFFTYSPGLMSLINLSRNFPPKKLKLSLSAYHRTLISKCNRRGTGSHFAPKLKAKSGVPKNPQ